MASLTLTVTDDEFVFRFGFIPAGKRSRPTIKTEVLEVLPHFLGQKPAQVFILGMSAQFRAAPTHEQINKLVGCRRGLTDFYTIVTGSSRVGFAPPCCKQ